MRRFLLALVVLSWLLQTAQVSAQDSEPFELTWTAPRGCVSADEVRARTRKLAGAANTAGAPLRAEATIARHDNGELHLHLVVRIDNLVGERDMVGNSCNDLAGATAVALALLLRSAEPLTEDDLTGHAPPDSAVQAGGAVAAPATPSPVVSQPAATPAPVERSWRALLQVPLLAVGIGPLRKPSLAIALAAGASFGAWYWLADGRVWLPQHETAQHPSDRYGARVQHFGAGLRGCRAFAWPRFELAPCVAVSAEHLSARGTGSHVARSDASATWVAAAVGAQGRLHVTPWLNLILGLDLQVETSRPKLVIDGLSTVEQLGPVAVLLTLGSEWIL